jgi:hypothetical protein
VGNWASGLGESLNIQNLLLFISTPRGPYSNCFESSGSQTLKFSKAHEIVKPQSKLELAELG